MSVPKICLYPLGGGCRRDPDVRQTAFKRPRATQKGNLSYWFPRQANDRITDISFAQVVEAPRSLNSEARTPSHIAVARNFCDGPPPAALKRVTMKLGIRS
jgi:hypothetical protein